MAEESTYHKQLTGAEKAAILLLSVNDENAAKIFAMMTEEEIKEISTAMSSLGVVSPAVIDQLINEFTSEISNTTSFIGNIETTERILGKILDKDHVKNIIEEIKGPAGKNTWDKLGNVNEDILATYLKNEYPQTVALIISKLSAAQSAKILSILPENFAFEVIMRMLNMEPVKKEVLDRVEKTLRSEFITSLSRTQKYDTKEAVAEIFNNFDRAHESKFMSLLESNSPESAENIKDLMFTFNDLTHISGSGIQALLRSIDKSKLSLALKGAPEQVRNLFLSNMSQRAAKILLEDIESLGPVRVRDVDEAQGAIVNLARDMANKGEIAISGNNEEDELIY